MRHYKYNTTQCIAEYSHQPSAVSPELTLGKLNHLGALRTIVFTEVSVCVCCAVGLSVFVRIRQTSVSCTLRVGGTLHYIGPFAALVAYTHTHTLS